MRQAGPSRANRRGTASGGWDGLVMDVDDDDSVRDGVAGLLAGGGRIDALVASAGWGLAGAVEQCTIGEAKAQLETNFWGCVRVVQQVLPAMRAQGAGRIVLISSIGGLIGIPFQAFYSASKFALEGLGEALAYEVAPLGVQVTLVQPGNIKTDFTASRRMAQAADGDPVYGAALAKAVGLMERDEANGAPAADVAAVVRRVLESRRPPRRASAGKAGERAGLLAKRLLPFRAFEAAAKGSLGVLASDVVGSASQRRSTRRRRARYSRSAERSPRCGVHDSMTSNVASGFSRVMTTSEMSARNRSPSGPPGGPEGTARPAIFASPGHSASLPSCGWKVGPCRANLGSRRRSAPLRAPGIDPNLSSPSANSHSMPEIRGEPSARSVAIVLCLPASNRRRTRAANSGSACSTSFHAAIAAVCARSLAGHMRPPASRPIVRSWTSWTRWGKTWSCCRCRPTGR